MLQHTEEMGLNRGGGGRVVVALQNEFIEILKYNIFEGFC